MLFVIVLHNRKGPDRAEQLSCTLFQLHELSNCEIGQFRSLAQAVTLKMQGYWLHKPPDFDKAEIPKYLSAKHTQTFNETQNTP